MSATNPTNILGNSFFATRYINRCGAGPVIRTVSDEFQSTEPRKERYIYCGMTDLKISGPWRRFRRRGVVESGSIQLITVAAHVIRRAEEEIEPCGYRHPDAAEILFRWILREMSGKHGADEFVLNEAARCQIAR
jgi:hypothetical protein